MAETPTHSDQIVDQVAVTYARSLYELAEPAGILADALDELRQIDAIVRDSPELTTLFEHKTIDPARRGESIKQLFSGQVHNLVLRFLIVLNNKGRLGALPGIVVAYDRMLKEHRNQVDVDVYTAEPLDEELLRRVEERLSTALERSAIVHPHTDRSLIGGMRIRYEDKLIDASVAAQLRHIGHRLAEGGQTRLRGKKDQLLEVGADEF